MKKETPPNLPLSGEERREAPYPGLRPYHEDEQGKFFGRDVDAEILLDKVLTNRLTLLFAASGVGKSSLLQAAVIPRLKSPTGENLEVVYHIDWVSEPVSSVRTAVLQALHTSGKLPEGAADGAGQTLAELLEFCGLFVRHPLVLILDQFEEFFRYQRATTSFQPFIEQLTAVITNPQLPVSLVLSMREDFALELNAFKPRLPTILFENFYRLEKLGKMAAQQAIVEPATQVGWQYEPELLERLLKDLSDRRRDMDDMPHLSPIVVQETIEPPYLQIVCARLWELNAGDKNQRLRLASYERVECAEGILKSFLDNVLADFSQAEKQLLSKAFDYLATQRGIKMAYPVDVLAKILRVKEQKLGTVLEKLADVRVLRSQQRDGGMWYELYHDMFSSSIETWNNAWKKQQLRRRQIIAAPLVIIFILLSDSFFWSLRNGLPLNYMLMQQKFRLMNWGLLPEPLPEVIDIPTPKGEFRVGEYDKSFGEMANKSLNQAGQHNFLNFGYPNTSATVQNSFAFGKYEVTYEQYDYYVWQQDKDNPPVYPGNAPNENKRGLRAVVNVSWNDANAYLNWLSEKTGRNYRLPTEVEWEYAARAGTYTPYWWGNETEQAHANCNGCGSQWDNKFIAPVGSFPPNSFGLYDTAGNVWEWTCSNWQEEFDGSETRCAIDDQSSRVVRGGSWDNSSDFMRSSVRAKYSSSSRLNNVGFRVVLAKKSR